MARDTRFSRHYETFGDWEKHAGNSSYANRIRRLHAQYPKRTLQALRKSDLRNVPLSKRNYNALTGKQQQQRENALEAKRKLMHGQDLSTASAAVGIRPDTVILNLGNAITIRADGKVVVRESDDISRSLLIYTNGHAKAIVVNDSGQASIIGHYFNAVQEYLSTGDEDALLAFEGMTVTDENGEQYLLETDPEEIKAIAEASEDREFHKIYTGGS